MIPIWLSGLRWTRSERRVRWLSWFLDIFCFTIVQIPVGLDFWPRFINSPYTMQMSSRWILVHPSANSLANEIENGHTAIDIMIERGKLNANNKISSHMVCIASNPKRESRSTCMLGCVTGLVCATILILDVYVLILTDTTTGLRFKLVFFPFFHQTADQDVCSTVSGKPSSHTCYSGGSW